MASKQLVRTVLGCLEFGRLNTLEQSKEMIDICLRSACHEFDTTAEYSGSKSEKFLGEMESLKNPNIPVIIASKAHPWGDKGLKFDSVLEQLNSSLENLKRKSIDVFYLHAPDHNTPIEETLEAVNKLHKEIYYLCKSNNCVLPTVYQGMYNPVTRDVERELFPCIRKLGLRFYAYNPLCGGVLTGKHRYDEINAAEKQPKGRFFNNGPWVEAYQKRYWKKFLFEMVDKLKTNLDRIYGEGQVSAAEASFRWMYHHSKMDGNYRDAVILGISSKNHLEENLKKENRGPLHEDILKVFDEGWEQMKADCPSYLR